MLTTLSVLSPLTCHKVSKNRGSAACCDRKAQPPAAPTKEKNHGKFSARPLPGKPSLITALRSFEGDRHSPLSKWTPTDTLQNGAGEERGLRAGAGA